jgi:hypothetical protein
MTNQSHDIKQPAAPGQIKNGVQAKANKRGKKSKSDKLRWQRGEKKRITVVVIPFLLSPFTHFFRHLGYRETGAIRAGKHSKWLISHFRIILMISTGLEGVKGVVFMEVVQCVFCGDDRVGSVRRTFWLLGGGSERMALFVPDPSGNKRVLPRALDQLRY